MLDLFNLDKLGLTSLSIFTGSTTGSEKWEIWGSNSLQTPSQSRPPQSWGQLKDLKT